MMVSKDVKDGSMREMRSKMYVGEVNRQSSTYHVRISHLFHA